ncbi:MAG: choice-of-anchor Q domain-containing protein, partial [Mariniphaga sp.]
MKSKITFFLAFFLVITMGLNNSLSGASFTGSGATFTINIDDASTTLSVVATATGYTFTLSGGAWTGSATGAFASDLDLTIDATGLSTYDTFRITDGAAGTAVTFNMSDSNTYKDNFNINLDGDGAGGIPGIINFNGASSFIGSNAISVVTTTNIVFNESSSLSTVDGNLTLDANTQLPYTSLDFNGIYLNRATVRATGTGTVNVKGRSGASAGFNTHGIYISEDGILSGGTTGTLTVQGWGSANMDSNPAHGVFLYGNDFTPTITTLGADVSVIGKAQSTNNTGSGCLGVMVGQSGIETGRGLISSGANGNVTVTGYGSTSPVPDNTGVGVFGTSASITSGGAGLVKVTGIGGGSSSTSFCNYGVFMSYVSVISSGAGGSVEVNGTGGTENSGLQNFGVFINNSMITCGTGSGTVKVTGTGGGKLTSSQNRGINVSGSSSIKAGGSGSVTVTGQGGTNVTGTDNYGIYLCGSAAPYPIITSNGGDVNVSGTGGGGSISNHGIYIQGGQIASGGTGTVNVSGQGGNQTGTDGDSNMGIILYANTDVSQIISNGGNIIVNGTGGGGSGSSASSASSNYGVYMSTYSVIKPGGNGTVSVTGKGGNNSTGGTGGYNYGIYLSDYSDANSVGTRISSTNGNVTVMGTGGGDGGSGTSNNGVNVESGAYITSDGAGTTVSVTGTGGNSSGSDNYGVQIGYGTTPNFSKITSGGGNVSVNGTGGGVGESITNYGVLCLMGGNIMAGGTGTVTVVGQGGNPSGTGNFNSGVQINSTSSTITSNGGNVSVTGTGGGALTSSYNLGVDISTDAVITAGGTGTVSVSGNGGNLLGTGSDNHGVNFSNLTASITSGGGNIAITGKEGGESTSLALYLPYGSLSTATNGGNITLVGNTIIIGSDAALSCKPAGSITLRQRTDGVGIDLGSNSDTNGGPLALSSNELGRISGGGTVNIGNSLSGTLNISDIVTNTTGIAKLNLYSPTGQGITPTISGTDLDLGTNTLGFGTDSPLKVNINGITVDTEYDQLNVTGNVDLNVAALTLAGSYTPVVGDIFTIVSATGVTNTFKDLAEGATVLFKGVSLVINYTATTVTLTAQACNNPTSGGVIAAAQSGSSPFDPVAFTSTNAASGQTGTIEYKWQSSTTSSSSDFGDIASSNSETYDPGSLTVATWYKRLARVGCKSDWTGAVASNVLAITIPAAEPTAQATNLYFSNTVSEPSTNIGLNYTASASATSYLVVRKTGSAPTFVPVDGTAYTIGAQGSDQVVYVGTALTCTDASITKDLSYYYKVYAFNGSNESCNYLISNPLDGNSICYSGASATMANNPGKTVSAGFPDQGINITFPNGTSGPTINASKTSNTPSSNFSVLPGVRGVANLYFTITSTEASPGNYTLVLDFSSLALSPASKWNTFKILKRTDSSSAWKDITTLGGTIVNRQTDGIPGKFTITGLSSFSDFTGGEENNTWTVLNPFETGEGSLKDLIAAPTTLDGDVIIFSIATSDTINLSSPVVVDKNLTIRGVAGGIVLNGYYATRVLEIADTKVVRLENLKIHNGHSIDATGGGIWNNGDLTMINCVISGNQDEGADGVGGILQYSNGLDNPNDVLNLVNCTITDNNGTAPNSTGTGGLISTGGVVSIYNSIIYGNIGGTNTDVEPASTIHEAWNSCFGNYANMTIESLDISNISDNPLFAGIVANSTDPFTLLSSSPCIDAGDDSYSFETTDIRGGNYSRKLDKSTGVVGTIDMGAYEYNINNYWSGATSTTWNDDTNWNSGIAPTSSDRIVIPSSPSNQPHVTDPVTAPAVCLDLTIQLGAVVTIDAGKALSVSGNLTNSAGTTGMVIKSDATGTGSLKILGSVLGSATVERIMEPAKWHIVSAPAIEDLSTFLTRNIAIPASSLNATILGMKDYNTTINSWNGSYTTSTSGSMVVGKGYLVRTEVLASEPTILDFKGTLYAGNKNVTVSLSGSNGWNCIGNPYTSAIKLSDGTEDASGLDNFLDVNNANIDVTSFGAYIYTTSGSAGGYEVINYATAESDRYAALGQGFFVKAKTDGSAISFKPAMQFHKTLAEAPYKSAENPRSSIKLKVDNGIANFSTEIMFIDGTTKGLDKGYDAGILKADPSFAIYTKLV